MQEGRTKSLTFYLPFQKTPWGIRKENHLSFLMCNCIRKYNRGHLRGFYFCLQLLGNLIMTIQSERMAGILMKNTNLNDTFVVCD